MQVLKNNWAAAKDDPSIFVMGFINFSQLGCLLACLASLTAMSTTGLNRSLLLVATIAACASVLLWFVTTLVGAKQYSQQIASKRGIDELLGMTEALQSAETYEDTASVLIATSRELLPDLGGALYVFNNSRDRLDLAGSWNLPSRDALPSVISPGNCWALKRGKAHVNRSTSTKLRCAHHDSELATLEVPMVARGAVYGLLVFIAEDSPEIARRFAKAWRSGQAMADAMSLALSNIALREKLRTQSLRDPLTGLFNRRYMEDALDRFGALAEKNGSALSVLMMDLDNFKRLNDEHGHAKGDAVLRDVSGQLIGGLRSCDVVCRYGGEEIIAILPDCPLDDAVAAAEILRARIEQLSPIHGAEISASIGVATYPQACTRASDLVEIADKALYDAKLNGKNRVVTASAVAAPARLAMAS